MKPQPFFKPLLLLVLLVVAGGFEQPAMAQYQSFFGDSITEYSIGVSVCTKEADPFFFNVESVYLRFDTTNTAYFNGNEYLSCVDYQESFYLREDTAYGRIFRWDTETDREFLICDMSLSQGDSFPLPYHALHHNSNAAPLYVVVDTVMYLNDRKYVYFDENVYVPFMVSGMQFQLVFIEGIGPTYSPIGWKWSDHSDCEGVCVANGQLQTGYYPFLLCVHKDDELVYVADERAGCWQTIGGGVEENESGQLKLFPNPVAQTMTVSFSDIENDGELYISDMQGRVLYYKVISGESCDIDVHEYASGMYLVTYFTANRKISVKFVKE